MIVSRANWEEVAGLLEGRAERPETRLDRLRARFRALYGSEAEGVARAPARINILGEHVDYVSYIATSSLTFGSRAHDMLMLFRGAPSARVRGATTLDGCEQFSFDARRPADAASWLSYLYARPSPPPDWGNYVRGGVLRAAFDDRAPDRGFDFLVDAAIAPGGGASSSSALVVLAGAVFRYVNGTELEARTLAKESAEAEWYVGTRGGAMDHTTICLARRNRAVHIQHRDARADDVPLSLPRARWVTFFTHPAEKGREAMLAYNERAAVARLFIPAVLASGADAIGALPEEIALAQLQSQYPEAWEACRRAFPVLAALPGARRVKLRDRARHHESEARRVEAAVRLLGAPESEDATLRALGRLLDESHESLRGCYEVTTPEVDRLHRIIAAAPEVYGARLMGAGFGGNLLALTTDERVAPLLDRARAEHRDWSEAMGTVMISTPGDGLSLCDCRENERRGA
jgi:galactokinase